MEGRERGGEDGRIAGQLTRVSRHGTWLSAAHTYIQRPVIAVKQTPFPMEHLLAMLTGGADVASHECHVTSKISQHTTRNRDPLHVSAS